MSDFDFKTLLNQLTALSQNVLAWFIDNFLTDPKKIQDSPKSSSVCIEIPSAGGLNQLKFIDIPGGIATCGYNLDRIKPPYVSSVRVSDVYKEHYVIVETNYFSVNYADICIRWGLYESALRYVGWPIVPGFDFSGTVAWAGPSSEFTIGEKVFGFTMFGAYSSKILVPASQIRRVPESINMAEAASVSAVAGTALHALMLAGGWPHKPITTNKAVLVHSAAGGVGSMLLQMCKLTGYSPIVAVVGSPHKTELCKKLGADVVIVKSELRARGKDVWKETLAASEGKGFIAVFDANGAETLSHSYRMLSRCGRLITYGFHSNLPRESAALSPWRWVQMAVGLLTMPRFDPMQMVLESKAVLGFNLSFFADEHELIEGYMEQLLVWLENGDLVVPEITEFEMQEIGLAHKLIQSGSSVGKIVIRCPELKSLVSASSKENKTWDIDE